MSRIISDGVQEYDRKLFYVALLCCLLCYLTLPSGLLRLELQHAGKSRPAFSCQLYCRSYLYTQLAHVLFLPFCLKLPNFQFTEVSFYSSLSLSHRHFKYRALRALQRRMASWFMLLFLSIWIFTSFALFFLLWSLDVLLGVSTA